MKLKQIFNIRFKSSAFSILIILIYVFSVNSSHKFWTHEKKIIEWDVKSYYAYLPATFIHKDLTFCFLDTKKEARKNIYTLKLKNGNRIVQTTYGMSIVYFPAFFIANNLAESLGYKANGFSRPYKFAIVLLAYIYLMIGLLYLRKILIKFFSDNVVAITLLAASVGTNLLYYASYESGMTHIYNFTLITIFLYHTIQFHEYRKIKHLIYLGLLGGFITLIRPTNILIYLLLAFWNTTSIKSLKEIFLFWIKNYKYILILIFLFLLVWLPQMIYWKIFTGQFLFFSYGEKNAKFFFLNPQISNFLFSYWKGWYVYTPIMFIASIGLIWAIFKKERFAIAISLYLILIVYVLSSWWSWWFGGSFGQRSMVDAYGIMAIPLAFAISKISLKPYYRLFFFFSLIVLIWYNIFQKNQYMNHALHYWGMTKEMYWENFLKPRPTKHYKKIMMKPDYKAARQGIYRQIPVVNKKKKERKKEKKKESLIDKNNQK